MPFPGKIHEKYFRSNILGKLLKEFPEFPGTFNVANFQEDSWKFFTLSNTIRFPGMIQKIFSRIS